MIEDLTRAQYDTVLREDFASFVARCFYDLNPQTDLATNWHLEIIAAKLIEVRRGTIKRLIINLPPRHLKSLLASIAFPAWCLGHDPSAQILCVSYAQDLADKLARDCRSIMMSPWYRQIFPTRRCWLIQRQIRLARPRRSPSTSTSRQPQTMAGAGKASTIAPRPSLSLSPRDQS